MEDDDGPMALGADEAAAADDMSDLQASTAAAQQSDSDDDESDSDDSDDDDDDDSDSGDSDDDEDDDKTKEETESDAPTKLSGESQTSEDKTKIKADKKKGKKIKKQKKLKKGVADKEGKKVPQQQEASVQLLGGSDAAQDTAGDLKADKAKAKKKSKSIDFKPEKPEEEASSSLKTMQESSSKLTDDDSPVLLNSLNVAVDDTTDLKAGTAKVENKTKVTEFKAESNDDESSKSTPSENNNDNQFEDGDDDTPGLLLGADDAAQDDNDMITPGTAASENNNDNQFEDGDDDTPGLLLGADDAAQEDNDMITPGTAASENNNDNQFEDGDDNSPGLLLGADDAAQDENITPGTAASEKNEFGDDTKVDEQKSSIKETKQIILPDMDESERAMYDYVAECREVFAYVDSTEKGTIPLSAMPHALHCLGLCPFTCDIDAMEEEAAESKEIGFAFFMATAMRIRKRERLTKTPGVVVMDTWGQLDTYMGLNGKFNLDDLKGILSQMGDGMDTSELASSFQNSRQFVDEYGMLDFASWLKSIDPSFGA